MQSDLDFLIYLLDISDNDRILTHSILKSVAKRDLLTHVACRFSIPEAVVYERAARYYHLPFSSVIPRGLKTYDTPHRLDFLGEARSLRARLFDRDVIFLAPGVAGLQALAQLRSTDPERYRDICIVPPKAIFVEIARRHGSALLEHSRQRLARQWPFSSAHLDFTRSWRIGFVAIILILVGCAAVAPFWAEPVMLPILLMLFLPVGWFRLAALLEPPVDKSANKAIVRLADADLPIYSLLIPLRDEAHMVPQICKAMQALDYPPEKLDIKFIVEATSPKTVQAVQAALGDPRFSIVIVPEAGPHTKPKALNFAMPLVRGSRVVIYDAEDVPEPQQLRKAAAIFARDMDVDCLQAELVIDNADESWISALFASEYSGLFGIMLPAIDRWRLPMPLGGTSNHFRTRSLREAGGWDAFNVTEDADLGIRLSRLRYRIGTLDSTTSEEAPVSVTAWLNQRSRWIKGWMQTYAVHNKRALNFIDDAGWRAFLAFQIYVGGMIVSAPLHLAFSIAVAVRLILAIFAPEHGISPPDFIYVLVFVTGYLGSVALSIAGAIHIGNRRILWHQLLLPVYWLLTGVAAFRAMYELVARPYFWSKTRHGVTQKPRGTGMPVTRATSAKRAGPLSPLSPQAPHLR